LPLTLYFLIFIQFFQYFVNIQLHFSHTKPLSELSNLTISTFFPKIPLFLFLYLRHASNFSNINFCLRQYKFLNLLSFLTYIIIIITITPAFFFLHYLLKFKPESINGLLFIVYTVCVSRIESFDIFGFYVLYEIL